ncbi:hypothetical protein [Mucilaginibacter glaciei]|uniref:Uncharacterized protein n=1 Tax=Mucilaginibacter glaciei TaxID=2772109 RepID=A0A926S4M4_9SPHI|nr:hypothetical protein [Mucilaginibacter glaciei]MBD1391916.1 hypothetical protein [Mucilaginibacter glaciei]
MKSKKPLIRRTFLQERFDILIKKQRNGDATFSDLTELDWIVNRDPAIREFILDEMSETDENQPQGLRQTNLLIEKEINPGLWEELKALINRLFMSKKDGLSLG